MSSCCKAQTFSIDERFEIFQTTEPTEPGAVSQSLPISDRASKEEQTQTACIMIDDQAHRCPAPYVQLVDDDAVQKVARIATKATAPIT